MPSPGFAYKVRIDLCKTCPRLEFCQDFPYLPLGHHPAGRCPDGFMEKVFVWELPGPKYRRAKGTHSSSAIASHENDTYASFNRPGYDGYKTKWCVMCAVHGERTKTTKGSKYWLCLKCVSKVFVHWKRKNRALIDEFKGRIHQGYIYRFEIRRKYTLD